MLNVTSKFEVNVLTGHASPSDMDGISSFLIKNRIPALVVEPGMVEMAVVERSRYSGAYKVICAVDFRDGKHYALEKIRDLPRNSIMVDGFEFLITPGRSDKESLNELRALTEFVRSFGQLKEIRWVMGFRTRPTADVQKVLNHVKTWPASFIRTDSNLASPGMSLDDHREYVKVIRSFTKNPIKVSGNVDKAVISELSDVVSRFDVSVSQARKIISSLREKVAK